MLRFIDIRLGESPGACTRCCGRVETLREASGVLAEIAEVTSSWTTPLGPNLTLAGAEPFHHPALPDFIAAAVSGGAQRIRLDSDCHALAAPGSAVEAIQAGIRHVRFTLLGAESELHDALFGQRGALERTLAGVRAFTEAATAAKAPVHVTARVPVCRHNLQHVPATVTAAAEAGASAVLLSVEDAALDLRTAAPWLEAACDTGIVNTVWVEVEGVPYGLAAGWELHLASNYRHMAGTKTDRCSDCPLDDVCPGAVRGASADVVARFRPPGNAEIMQAGVRRAFAPPACDGILA